MKNNEPKKQHTMPKMFLDGFAGDNGLVWRYHKQTNTFDKDMRNPKSISRLLHAYTIGRGNKKNYKVENVFRDFETEISPILKKLLEDDGINLTESDVVSLLKFAILLSHRSELVLDLVKGVANDKDTHEEIRKVIKTSGGRDEDADLLIRECMETEGFVYALTLGAFLDNRLNIWTKNFDIKIAKSTGDVPLIVNDTYMCLEPIDLSYKENRSEDLDWSNMNVCINFPLSKSCCMSLIPRSKNRQGNEDFQIIFDDMDELRVFALNRISFIQARAHIYSSEKSAIIDI